MTIKSAFYVLLIPALLACKNSPFGGTNCTFEENQKNLMETVKPVGEVGTFQSDGKFKEAEEKFLEAYKMSKCTSAKGATTFGLCEFYLETENFKSAEHYCLENLNFSESIKSKQTPDDWARTQIVDFEKLALVYRGLGDSAKAGGYEAKRAKVLSENPTIAKDIAELEAATQRWEKMGVSMKRRGKNASTK